MCERLNSIPLIENYFRDDQPIRLDEITYKELLHAIDPRDLPHRDYAPLIKFVKFVGIEKNTMKFFVPNGRNGWNTYIRFPQWGEQVADKSLDANEAARLLLWSGNIQFHCGCPAYLFWGMQYIMTQLDAAIVPENRFPAIRNPQLLGTLCKHGRRTVKVLPFHLANMAAAIKQQRLSQ